MDSNIKINRQTLEAFLDEELSSSEMQEVSTQIEQDESVRHLYNDVAFHKDLLHTSVNEGVRAATAQIDWQLFEQRFAQRFAQEVLSLPTKQPTANNVSPTITKESGLWQWVSQSWLWLRQHPGVTMTCCATMGIIIILAIPFFDPGPKTDQDAVVEKIANIDTAQVAVLQAKNKSTGKPMTVIVIDEPAQDAQPPQPPLSKNRLLP